MYNPLTHFRKLLWVVAATSLFLFFLPTAVSAREAFVTVVNPVRVSSYTEDVSLSMQAQSKIVTSLNLPATWLLTYDVLKTDSAIAVAKNFSKDQDLGLFL